MDLIRLIVMALEDHDRGEFARNFPQTDHGDEALHRHLHMLMQRGYIDGAVVRPAYDTPYHKVLNPYLTYTGYDLLDQMKDDTIFNRAKEAAGPALGQISIGVFQELLKKAMFG